MNQRAADEESYFSEESYYEEEEYTEVEYYTEEEDPASPVRASQPAPSARPAHPLFGSAGAKNALATASTNMDKKHVQNPVKDSLPSRSVAAGPASSGPAAAPPPSRPVHPLFGGGGGGGAPRGALNDQIKAMAAKRNERVAEGGVQMPEPAQPQSSVNAVMQPGPRAGAGMQSGSLADQVAMMAARRQNRMSGQGTEPEVSSAPPHQAAPPTTNYARRGEPGSVAPPAQSVATRTPPPPKTDSAAPPAHPFATRMPPPKTNSSRSDTKPLSQTNSSQSDTKPLTRTNSSRTKLIAKTNSSRVNTTPDTNKPGAAHTFQKSIMQKPDAISSRSSHSTHSAEPAFLKAKLKPTGKNLAAAALQEQFVKEKHEPEQAQPVVTRRETPGVEAGPSTSIKRVIKSDPTYEIVEYKCYCTIM